MHTLLQTVLSQFSVLREKASQHSSFVLLYDSVTQIAASQDTTDVELLKQIDMLFGLYELVTRSEQSTVFMDPYSCPNRFMTSLISMISAKTNRPLHEVFYARSLVWPEHIGNWYDPLLGGAQLPIEHGEFAITTTGEICLLEPLIDTAIQLFSEGHREHDTIWKSNDPRTYNQPLSPSFLQSLCTHFPAFKQLYEQINLSCATSPIGRLQALREGLRDGSKMGSDKLTRGSEFYDGSASTEAIYTFLLWWNEIAHPPYQSRKSLRQALGELNSRDVSGRNLEDFIKIINIFQNRTENNRFRDATTCVQLRGDELQSFIEVNFQFLLSLEQPTAPTKIDLMVNKHKIIASFYHDEHPICSRKVEPTLLYITVQGNQLPYYAYAVTQLWDTFRSGDVSDASLLELSILLGNLSADQRQQLWNYPMDFYPTEKTACKQLRQRLYLLERKLEENTLLPIQTQHSLTHSEHALLDIISYNCSLLTWITLRYEFIIFSSRALSLTVINKGFHVKLGNEQLMVRDLFDFAYYIHKKTEHRVEGAHKLSNVLCKLLDISNPTILSLNENPHPLDTFRRKLLNFATNREVIPESTQTELLSLLIKNPILTICSLDSNDRTFLDHAFSENNSAVIIPLIQIPEWDKLSKITNKTKNWSLFDAIAIAGHTDYYELLKETHHREDWPFALKLAVKFNNVRFCELLLNDGANPNIQYGDNTSLLMMAAKKGFTELCQLLLSKGALTHYQCNAGYTALTIASKHGHAAVCTLFLNHGVDPSIKTSRNKTADTLWNTYHSSHENPFATSVLFFQANTKEDTTAQAVDRHEKDALGAHQN